MISGKGIRCFHTVGLTPIPTACKGLRDGRSAIYYPPVFSPRKNRRIINLSLIANQRYYGEAPARLRRGYGVVSVP
jgi:hypothetical protein